ncbi:MAG TPA: DUF1697 domain-containing protein [Longimicrobium sp.]
MPMSRRVAFLRAINVGGHNVKMDPLKSIFAGMGFARVETFIASGNVIFDADGDAAELEARIERELRAALGYEVATFLRTPTEVAEAAAFVPLAEAVPALSIGFTRAEPDAEARARLAATETEVDAFHIRGRELYWSCRVPLSETRMTNARLERALGMPVTFRNVTTVRKLAAKYPPAPIPSHRPPENG